MISGLNSVFEILAVLNLAYAGSKTFRNTLNKDILKVQSAISKTQDRAIKKIESKYVVLASQNEPRFNDGLERIEKQHRFNRIYLRRKAEFGEGFSKGFHSIFLLVALYCLSILIISGHECFYKLNEIIEIVSYLNLVGIAILVIFIRNLFPSYMGSNVRPFYVVLIFIIPFFLYSFYTANKSLVPDNNIFVLSEKKTIIITLLIASSAFLLNFLRSYLHRRFIRTLLYFVNSYTSCLYSIHEDTHYKVVIGPYSRENILLRKRLINRIYPYVIEVFIEQPK